MPAKLVDEVLPDLERDVGELAESRHGGRKIDANARPEPPCRQVPRLQASLAHMLSAARTPSASELVTRMQMLYATCACRVRIVPSYQGEKLRGLEGPTERIEAAPRDI